MLPFIMESAGRSGWLLTRSLTCRMAWVGFLACNLIRECAYSKCADFRNDFKESWISNAFSDAICLGLSENSTSARDFASLIILVKWELTDSIATQSSRL